MGVLQFMPVASFRCAGLLFQLLAERIHSCFVALIFGLRIKVEQYFARVYIVEIEGQVIHFYLAFGIDKTVGIDLGVVVVSFVA